MVCDTGVAAGQIWDRCKAESNGSADAYVNYDSQRAAHSCQQHVQVPPP